MKNIKKSKNEEMKKKREKMKSKKQEKKTKREKKVGEKRKRGPKGVLPPEMGPKIDFSHKNCQEKS